MTFYRATLRLEEIEPSIDSNGYRRELVAERATHVVTGDTPADAMVQICAHADSLYDWHQEQADNADEVPPASLLYDAWCVIANAGWSATEGRDDLQKTPGWLDAAIRWRDKYHAFIGASDFPPVDPTLPAAAATDDLNARVHRAFQPLADWADGIKRAAAEEQLRDEAKRNCPWDCGCTACNDGSDAVERHRQKLRADVEAPFVACKAPNPNALNEYCHLPLRHSVEDHTPCQFVPAEKLPASADDEGDAECAINGCGKPVASWGVCKRHLADDDLADATTGCAHCPDVIQLINGEWRHSTGNRGHIASPAITEVVNGGPAVTA